MESRCAYSAVFKARPRSNATILRPAEVSCLAKIPPTAPTPTMQTSAIDPFMTRPASSANPAGNWREIDHLIDISFGITPLLARKTDQFPADHISVAAVAGLTENALQYVSADQLEELPTIAQLGY